MVVAACPNTSERLDLKPNFDGARRKRMPQRVKMHSLKAAFAVVLFHPVLQGSWLHEAVRTSQNISG